MAKLYFKMSNFAKVRFFSQHPFGHFDGVLLFFSFCLVFFLSFLFLSSASLTPSDDSKKCEQQTLETYQKLLTYTKSAVTRNYSEKSINNMLDNISTSNNMDFLEKFYASTLQSLEESKNDVSNTSSSFFLSFFFLFFFFFHLIFKNLLRLFRVQRLAFKTNLKLAKVWLDRGEYVRLGKVCWFSFLDEL